MDEKQKKIAFWVGLVLLIGGGLWLWNNQKNEMGEESISNVNLLATTSNVNPDIATISSETNRETHSVTYSGSNLGINEFSEQTDLIDLLLSDSDWRMDVRNKLSGSLKMTFFPDRDPLFSSSSISFSGSVYLNRGTINYGLSNIKVGTELEDGYVDTSDRQYPFSDVYGTGVFNYNTNIKITRKIPVEWWLDTEQGFYIRGEQNEYGEGIRLEFDVGDFYSISSKCYDNDMKSCENWGFVRSGKTNRGIMYIADKFTVSNLKLVDFDEPDGLLGSMNDMMTSNINNIDMNIVAISDDGSGIDRVISKSNKGFSGISTFKTGSTFEYKLTNLDIGEDLNSDSSISDVFQTIEPNLIVVGGTGVLTYTTKLNLKKSDPVEFNIVTERDYGRVSIYNDVGLNVEFETPSSEQRQRLGTIIYSTNKCVGCNK